MCNRVQDNWRKLVPTRLSMRKFWPTAPEPAKGAMPANCLYNQYAKQKSAQLVAALQPAPTLWSPGKRVFRSTTQPSKKQKLAVQQHNNDGKKPQLPALQQSPDNQDEEEAEEEEDVLDEDLEAENSFSELEDSEGGFSEIDLIQDTDGNNEEREWVVERVYGEKIKRERDLQEIEMIVLQAFLDQRRKKLTSTALGHEMRVLCILISSFFVPTISINERYCSLYFFLPLRNKKRTISRKIIFRFA